MPRSRTIRFCSIPFAAFARTLAAFGRWSRLSECSIPFALFAYLREACDLTVMPHETPNHEDVSLPLSPAQRRDRALRRAVSSAFSTPALAGMPFERLETRRLMSASFENGVLRVDTLDGDDVVTFARSGSKLELNDNGETSSYTLTSVRRIEVTTAGGDDVVDLLGVDIPVVVNAGSGNDWVRGGNRGGHLYGGDGVDTLIGGEGDDAIYGENGNDQLFGRGGRDSLWGAAGNDVLVGGDGNDLIRGGAGNDNAWGGAGNDTLLGQEGNDLLRGGDDTDALNGYTGNDTLFGNDGTDALYGGAGDDDMDADADRGLLWGSDGNDRFVDRGSRVTFADFTRGQDQSVKSIGTAGEDAEPTQPNRPRNPKTNSTGNDGNGTNGGNSTNGGDSSTDTSKDESQSDSNDTSNKPTDNTDNTDSSTGGEDATHGGGLDAGDTTSNPGVILKPGNGFVGATAQPAAVGRGDFRNAQAVARWDVVPFQTFDDTFNVGVVAFHAAGIDRVSFSVDGGEWVSVSEPTLNKRTGVVEYWATLDASLFADGDVEVRAVAHPKIGEARVLDGLTLYSNGNGAYDGRTIYVSHKGNDRLDGSTQSSAVKTIEAALQLADDNDEIVLLDAGKYELGGSVSWNAGSASNDRWITVRGHESLDRDQITLTHKDRKTYRNGVERLRFQNVSYDTNQDGGYYQEFGSHLWFDDVHIYSSAGRYVTTGFGFRNSIYTGGKYATNVELSDMYNGLGDMDLVRDSHVERIVSDAFQNAPLLINSSMNDLHRGPLTHAHGDVLQYFGGKENIIVYGLDVSDVDAQGIFIQAAGAADGEHAIEDAAFVDIVLDFSSGTGVGKSQMLGSNHHVLYENVAWINQGPAFRTDMTGGRKFIGEDIVLRDVTLVEANYQKYIIDGDVPEGVIFENAKTW